MSNTTMTFSKVYHSSKACQLVTTPTVHSELGLHTYLDSAGCTFISSPATSRMTRSEIYRPVPIEHLNFISTQLATLDPTCVLPFPLHVVFESELQSKSEFRWCGQILVWIAVHANRNAPTDTNYF